MAVGKLIKIDCEIWDIRTRLTKQADAVLQAKLQALLKERDLVIASLPSLNRAREKQSAHLN